MRVEILNDFRQGLDVGAAALELGPERALELTELRVLVHLHRTSLADEYDTTLVRAHDPEILHYTPSLQPLPASADVRAAFSAGQPVITLVAFNNNLADCIKTRRRDDGDLATYELRVDVWATLRDGASETASARCAVVNPWYGNPE